MSIGFDRFQPHAAIEPSPLTSLLVGYLGERLHGDAKMAGKGSNDFEDVGKFLLASVTGRGTQFPGFLFELGDERSFEGVPGDGPHARCLAFGDDDLGDSVTDELLIDHTVSLARAR